MNNRIQSPDGRVYIVGTFDTKKAELLYVRDLIKAAGIPTTLVDVGIRSTEATANIKPTEIASYHPDGPTAVFLDDRGEAVTGMSVALKLMLQTKSDIVGMIGLGGSGGSAIITPAMRSLPIGVPKMMVSTMASGDVSAYVGSSDMFMLNPITDVAGLNKVLKRVLANAAHAILGMVSHPLPDIDDSKPALGLTMFGVTTPCVSAISKALEQDYDCLIFHATGTGGRAMEHLVDAGELSAVIDITTTEVCDLLFDGVQSAGEARLDSIARSGLPYVGSCGALDMVNFRGIESVPDRFKNRNLYIHNAHVTLMRTTVDECAEMGRWIGKKLNACSGPVEFLLPLEGVSSIPVEGAVFHDSEADAALFEALLETVEQTDTRKVTSVAADINDSKFISAALEAFSRVNTKQDF
jgi:uncharacterized protein (UPF0261 family)